jgi:CubicO group peptidase (beta-lactamase class C family)
MKKLKQRYYTSLLLSLFFVACHSNSDKASATPPHLPLLPVQMSTIKLVYDDTTSAEWKHIAKRLDSFYNMQARAGFNGSVLIGYKGKVLYERYVGYANKQAGVALSANNGVQLASVSKTFTGAAILYLYQNKYLDIDKPVTTYLKKFPYPDITLRMLLCHRSGLPNYEHWVPNYRKDTKSFLSNDEVLTLMIAHKPPVEFKANTHFKYCNTNYMLLACIIEEVTEMRYEAFLRKYIFEPLGMKNTFVYDPAKGLPNTATISYQAGSRYAVFPNDFRDGVYGDKGIYSTVEDMYRWDQSFYQNKFLSNETLEVAYGPCSFEKAGVKNYGLGWRMLCYPDGYKIIYHNGWWHGNNTCFYRFIKDNFTIIVLGNKLSNAIYRQPPVLYGIVKNAAETDGFDNGAE